MAKIACAIGFATFNDDQGMVTEIITEKQFKGDLKKIYKRWQSGDSMNDNLVLSNVVSIIADSNAAIEMQNIKYVVWNGVKWRVASIEISDRRFNLTLGGVYNDTKE